MLRQQVKSYKFYKIPVFFDFSPTTFKISLNFFQFFSINLYYHPLGKETNEKRTRLEKFIECTFEGFKFSRFLKNFQDIFCKNSRNSFVLVLIEFEIFGELQSIWSKEFWVFHANGQWSSTFTHSPSPVEGIDHPAPLWNKNTSPSTESPRYSSCSLDRFERNSHCCTWFSHGPHCLASCIL